VKQVEALARSAGCVLLIQSRDAFGSDREERVIPFS
jgi:hypothetical protein